MERSEIRGLERVSYTVPDCASLHPGYGSRYLGTTAVASISTRAAFSTSRTT